MKKMQETLQKQQIGSSGQGLTNFDEEIAASVLGKRRGHRPGIGRVLKGMSDSSVGASSSSSVAGFPSQQSDPDLRAWAQNMYTFLTNMYRAGNLSMPPPPPPPSSRPTNDNEDEDEDEDDLR